ncbi:MAG: SURF1 family protein, partial [Pseudomonadota bacterium]
NDHLGYAVTWFGMAAVWVSMTALFLYRGRRKRA